MCIFNTVLGNGNELIGGKNVLYISNISIFFLYLFGTTQQLDQISSSHDFYFLQFIFSYSNVYCLSHMMAPIGTIPLSQLEGTDRYARLLLAPADDFNLGPRLQALQSTFFRIQGGWGTLSITDMGKSCF